MTDREPKRWNFQDSAEGLLVCKGDHEKSEGCHYAKMTEADAVLLIDQIVTLQSTPASPTCKYCNDERQIETDNNGPIVDCPVCTPASPDTVDELRVKQANGNIGDLPREVLVVNSDNEGGWYSFNTPRGEYVGPTKDTGEGEG